MATQRRRTSSVLVFAIIGAVFTVWPARRAAAEINIAERDGWRLSTDGRLNNFLSVARGNYIPNGEQNFTGLDEEPTLDQNIASSRIRTGFIESVLAFELNKQLSEATKVKARVAMWMLTASLRNAGDTPGVEAREAYFQLEGDWGGLLVGRAMSLFARGGILLDYEIEHAFGLGSPCSTKEVHGGACGHAGFGLLFPGFHSGLVYNTPMLGGLQLSAGLYDPTQLAEVGYRRTPYPRVEGELTFRTPNRLFTAFVGGMWQQVQGNTGMGPVDPVTGQPTVTEQTFNASGINYGLGINIGPLQVGASGFNGKGLGFYVPLEDNPTNFRFGSGGLRSQEGYWGAVALVFGGTRVAAGAGFNRTKRDPDDPPEMTTGATPLERQLGVSAGVYQTVFKVVTFAAEYFGAQWTWFNRAQMVGTDLYVVTPRQTVNFFNVGATLLW
jgi:hypothetical protein